MSDITRILAALESAGTDPTAYNRAALNELLPLIYDQLRRSAQTALAAERAGHTLTATALVHEAYLKLVGPREIPWQGRAHFYAAAVEAMRRILLDHAKAKGRAKRGGGRGRLDLDAGATLAAIPDKGSAGEGPPNSGEESPDFVALDEALCRLERKDPRMAQVVRLRFYAGLDIAETARVLGVSERTVKNDWKFARAWLAKEITANDTNEEIV